MSTTIHQVSGRVVRTLPERRFSAGQHDVQWNGRDDDGRRLSSGIYYVRVHSGSETVTRKVALIE